MAKNNILDNVVLSEQDILGTVPPIAARVAPDMEYVDNKQTGKQLGIKVTVVAPDRQMESYVVKSPETTLPITQEELDELNASGKFVRVRFEGFEGKPWVDWRNNNTLKASCSAKKIILDIPGAKELK